MIPSAHKTHPPQIGFLRLPVAVAQKTRNLLVVVADAHHGLPQLNDSNPVVQAPHQRCKINRKIDALKWRVVFGLLLRARALCVLARVPSRIDLGVFFLGAGVWGNSVHLDRSGLMENP